MQKFKNILILQISVLIVIAGALSMYFESFAESNFDTNTVDKTSHKESVTIKIPKGALNENNKQFFVPENATITSGSTITWENHDEVAHTATSVDKKFDTGLIKPGETASVTINNKGVFKYKCSIHPWMNGVITVN